MLRVIYKAVELIESGGISDWSEDRGLVEIRVHRDADPAEFIPSLNATLADLLSKAAWYQLWGREVISIHSPRSPLRVTFELSRLIQPPTVDLREHKGHVALYVSPAANAERFVEALNPCIEKSLAAGQWFQMWNGEIVTMDSPGIMAA